MANGQGGLRETIERQVERWVVLKRPRCGTNEATGDKDFRLMRGKGGRVGFVENTASRHRAIETMVCIEKTAMRHTRGG